MADLTRWATGLEGVTYHVVDRGLDEGVAMVEARLGGTLIGALRWNYFEEPPVVVDIRLPRTGRVGTTPGTTALSALLTLPWVIGRA